MALHKVHSPNILLPLTVTHLLLPDYFKRFSTHVLSCKIVIGHILQLFLYPSPILHTTSYFCGSILQRRVIHAKKGFSYKVGHGRYYR